MTKCRRKTGTESVERDTQRVKEEEDIRETVSRGGRQRKCKTEGFT